MPCVPPAILRVHDILTVLLLLPCALLTVATSAAAFVGLVTTSSATTALALKQRHHLQRARSRPLVLLASLGRAAARVVP